MEQTTPMRHLLFDTSALARNLDFLDIDVDRDLDFFEKNLGKSKWSRGDIGLSFTARFGGFRFRYCYLCFIGWAIRKNSKIQEVMKGSQTISLQ